MLTVVGIFFNKARKSSNNGNQSQLAWYASRSLHVCASLLTCLSSVAIFVALGTISYAQGNDEYNISYYLGPFRYCYIPLDSSDGLYYCTTISRDCSILLADSSVIVMSSCTFFNAYRCSLGAAAFSAICCFMMQCAANYSALPIVASATFAFFTGLSGSASVLAFKYFCDKELYGYSFGFSFWVLVGGGSGVMLFTFVWATFIYLSRKSHFLVASQVNINFK